jgi:hypothetical protein
VQSKSPHAPSAWSSRWAQALGEGEHARVSALFLRLFALIHFSAFASFGVQALGLIGSGGILPLQDYVGAARAYFGGSAFWHIPFVFWLGASDRAIEIVVALGLIASLALLFGRLQRLALVTLYVLYLSLLYAGQRFMTYQWDILLVETTAVALFLPGNATLGTWLLRLLLFRFMFLSGAVKLLSGDPTWSGLTALDYHYETQPLPTLLAWYAHQLPEWFHRASVVITFVIELVMPFLIFGPRPVRFVAGVAFVFLEVLIGLTGNYNFFNLLAILLCLSLLDDRALERCLPRVLYVRLGQRRELFPALEPWTAPAAAILATILAAMGVAQIAGSFRVDLPAPIEHLLADIEPFQLVNTYGLFASMTTDREEIIVEGSNDGQAWSAYEFKYKPGDLKRAPGWMIPHQPRLDWQMWFAALGTFEQNPWFERFLICLLQGKPAVTALLAHDPFAGAPPRYIRALTYRYHFSDRATRAATGQWWTREPTGMYSAPAHLGPALDDGRGPSPH